MNNDPIYNGKNGLALLAHLPEEKRLEILQKHPFFTGRCFNCRKPVFPEDSLQADWQCSECGWDASDLQVPGSPI